MRVKRYSNLVVALDGFTRHCGQMMDWISSDREKPARKALNTFNVDVFQGNAQQSLILTDDLEMTPISLLIYHGHLFA